MSRFSHGSTSGSGAVARAGTLPLGADDEGVVRALIDTLDTPAGIVARVATLEPALAGIPGDDGARSAAPQRAQKFASGSFGERQAWHRIDAGEVIGGRRFGS
jgi:hypothetical protein